MPTALQRRSSAPAEVPMWSNGASRAGEWGHNMSHIKPTIPFQGGPCAPSQTSRPSVVSRSCTAPAASLCRKTSPYTYVPPPNVEMASPDLRQRAEVLRPLGIPDTQPHPPRRLLRPIALPPQIQGVTSVVMNPALAKGRASLSVDLASMSIPTSGSNAAWWHRLLSEPATCPELPSLTILSPRLPWAMTAHASGRSLRCVTVADVLGAICEALRLHVDEEQFKDWMTQSGSHCPRWAGIGYRDGMTRMDLLEGQTKFMGLEPSRMGCDIWVLEVA